MWTQCWTLRRCSTSTNQITGITSPHLTSPHLTSPHLTSPHLTSPHLTTIAISHAFDTVSEISLFDVSHSRIPVYEGERTNLIGLLLIKVCHHGLLPWICGFVQCMFVNRNACIHTYVLSHVCAFSQFVARLPSFCEMHAFSGFGAH